MKMRTFNIKFYSCVCISVRIISVTCIVSSIDKIYLTENQI